MKSKVGTTAYQRKTKTQRDVRNHRHGRGGSGEGTGRAINDRSKESKALRGIIRGGVHIL